MIFINRLCFLLVISLISLNPLRAQQQVDNSFEIINTVELQDEQFNYGSSIRVDRDGNFMVIDMQQGAFLLYNSEGDFIRKMGRKGRGPGEFEYIMHVERLADGEYLASDMTGRLTRFSSEGDEIDIYNLPWMPLTSFVALDEETVLVPAMDKQADDLMLLHEMNLKTKETNSFFPAPFKLGDYGGILNNTSSVVKAITNGEHIYAFVTFLNEMYVFTMDGELVKKVPVPFKHFRNLEKQENMLSQEELSEVMVSYSLVTDLFWKNNSTLIIQYWQATEVAIPDYEGYVNLAEIDLDGNVLYEEKNSTRLFDYSKGAGSYFFLDSLSLEHDVQNIIEAKK